MNEGADSIAHTCENSLTTLKTEDNPDEPPPRTISHTGRLPRFGIGNVPISPFILIDGKKLRSALAFSKKWPPRRVSFPTNATHLVTGYLEPANPWRHAENVNRESLISAYKESCIRHNTEPLQSVLTQLQNLDIIEDERCDVLCLKGETLDQNHSEPLEEILKRIQFNKIDLEGTSLDEESSVILFDMMEYYESAKQINISSDQDIGVRGWQACSHMIKKTQCLEQLEAKDVTLNEQYMNILSRALRLVYHLHILKLENCGLSGRAIVLLVSALKMNTGIRELYLADNGLDLYDAIQLGSLLRLNNHLQLLDISNNNIQDDGVRDILEGLINQVNEDKDGKGLSILVLWNNRLTKKSSPHFSRIIALSKTLETLNIGQNMLTDEMLSTVRDPLKKNRTLLQLGMQSTDITCEGIITLCDIMDSNQVLQRIDLRDNSIQMTGMRALTVAMKKNNNITQIDLDDKPRIKIDGTLHQYMDLVAEIRSYCTRNEESRSLDENSENSENPQHHNRFCSASSRKISLTCQTLPCSPPPMTPISNDESGRSRLKPKRTSGGRLRSPAPSPIPSPVASPIPSPSRSRFVVSKVPETSLRSTDSLASSSPVTPSSFGSLSTCFFPPTNGSSRFRVSVVESASTVPSPKSVITSSKNNVTIGFNFKVDTVESTDSDDSDNVLKSELGTNNDQSDENARTMSSTTFNLRPNTVTNEDRLSGNECTNEREISTKECSISDTKVESEDSANVITLEYKEYCDKRDNQSNISVEPDNVTCAEKPEKEGNYCNESTKETQININVNENVAETQCVITNDNLMEKHDECGAVKQMTSIFANVVKELQPQMKKNSFVQKHTSSLEKLRALFQHRGSFFSDSSNMNQVDSKNPLQDNVNSMMVFGDKFHQYFREPKMASKLNTEGTYSSSDVSSSSIKSKSGKSQNMSQLSSLQNLANMFTSFKLDSNVNSSEQNTKTYLNRTENVNCSLEDKKSENAKDSVDVKPSYSATEVCNHKNTKLNACSDGQEVNVSSSNNQSLPEDVQSKDNDGHTSKDLVLEGNHVLLNAVIETCSKITSNASMTNVPESKTTVCIPKLKDIPEYSVLEISENNTKRDNLEAELVEGVVDSITVKKICDRSTTDSINLTSDSNSSSCNITCDIRVIDNVNTVSTPESTHNAVSLRSDLRNETGSITDSSTHGECDEISSVASKRDSDCTANDVSVIDHNLSNLNVEKNDCLRNEVTSIRYIDNNNDKESFVTSHNAFSEAPKGDNTCHVEEDSHWKSTIVNSKESSRISEDFTCKDNNNDFHNDDAPQQHQPSLGDDEEELANASQNQDSLERCNVEDSKQLSPLSNTDVHRTVSRDTTNESFLENTASDSPPKEADCTFVPPVILPYQKEPIDTVTDKEFLGDFEKSDAEDLIFCMTDISTDGTSVEEELSPGVISNGSSNNNWPNDSVSKTGNSYFDLPHASRSPTNLLIDRSDNVYKNSQDSGIGETNLSVLVEDNIPESIRSHAKKSFQDSVDSGIESECSSVCVKLNSGLDNPRKFSGSTKRGSNEMGPDDGAFEKEVHDDSSNDFESEIVPYVQSDAANDKTHSYLRCTVVTSTGISITPDTAPSGIITDESGTVIAEPSAIVQPASPK